MLIGEAVAALGIGEPEDRDLPLMWFERVGGEAVARHGTLRAVAGEEVGARDLYVGNGLFARDSIRRSGGRTGANLREVLRLAFDCDLTAFLGQPKDVVQAMTDEGLDACLADLRLTVEETFGQVGVPIHQLDQTGFGLCAYLRVDPAVAGEVEPLRTAYRGLVERLNRQAGYEMVDRQATDVGTRVTRLTPGVNTKGGRLREARTLARRDGLATVGDLGPAEAARRPPARIIAAQGPGLAAGDAAAVVDALRPAWRPSVRHALALGLAGWFAGAGLPEEQAAAIVAAASDGDEEPWDRRRAVRTTYQRARAGAEVRGYTAVRDLLDDATLSLVEGLLDRVGRSRVLVSPERQRRAAGRTRAAEAVAGAGWLASPSGAWPPLPESCLVGPIGEYVRLVSPTTEAGDALLLAGWLSVLAATCGRRVAVEYAEDLHPNLFIAGVGDTGFTRKDHAVSLAINTVHHQARRDNEGLRSLTPPPFGTSSDISSAQGLVKDLADVSSNLLVRLREMTTLLDNMRRLSTSTIADKCIELFDCPPETSNNSKKDGNRVVEPCLNIIATTQPQRLAEKMTNGDVVSGFGNRWLYLFGTDKGPMADPPRAPRDRMGDLWADFRDQAQAHRGRVLGLSDEAKAIWRPWYDRTWAEAKADREGGPMRIRHHPIARKVALLYAVADGALEVDAEHLRAGIDLVDWSWSILRHEVGGWGAGDEVQLERRVEAVLRQHGPMKKWRLQASCKRASWPQSLFHRVVDSMVRNGALQRNADDMVWLTEDDGEPGEGDG